MANSTREVSLVHQLSRTGGTLFAKVLGKIFFRPSFAPLPKFMVKILFGEMGEKLLLESQRVSPKRLLESGYEFNHPDLENALRHMTGKVR